MGFVKRDAGTLDQPASAVRRGAAGQTKPDTGGDIDRRAGQRQRLLRCGLQPCGKLNAGFEIEAGHREQRRAEGAIADPAQMIAFAQHAAQPGGAMLQHLFGDAIAEALVQAFETLNPDQEGGGFQALGVGGGQRILEMQLERVGQRQAGDGIDRAAIPAGERFEPARQQHQQRHTERHDDQRTFAAGPIGAEHQRGQKGQHLRAAEQPAQDCAEGGRRIGVAPGHWRIPRWLPHRSYARFLNTTLTEPRRPPKILLVFL